MLDFITQNWKFILPIVAILIIFIMLKFRDESDISIPLVNPIHKYVIKPYFFSIAEKEFYTNLKKVLYYSYWFKYEVYPKVRLADIFKPEKGEKWVKRLWSKHVDFLITDKDQAFKPMLAIELDWDSHKQYRQIKSDKFKNEVFNNSPLPLIRFKNNMSSNEEVIRSNIVQYLWTPNKQNT